MKQTTADKPTGIRRNMIIKLEDLDYADDIALLSSSKDHLQHTINKLVEKRNHRAKEKCMRINISSTQVIAAKKPTNGRSHQLHILWWGSKCNRRHKQGHPYRIRTGKSGIQQA